MSCPACAGSAHFRCDTCYLPVCTHCFELPWDWAAISAWLRTTKVSQDIYDRYLDSCSSCCLTYFHGP